MEANWVAVNHVAVPFQAADVAAHVQSSVTLPAAESSRLSRRRRSLRRPVWRSSSPGCAGKPPEPSSYFESHPLLTHSQSLPDDGSTFMRPYWEAVLQSELGGVPEVVSIWRYPETWSGLAGVVVPTPR